MRRPTFLLTLTLLLSPIAAVAQGRILARPCTPPCPPNAMCAVPATTMCGARVDRVSSTVNVRLADRVLRYEVTEIFRNNGGGIAEADYVFPLPPGAAFEDLKLSINGELVSGETMSAEKARGIYEEIVRKQRDPALVEWMGSGMLRARIFPIAPGEEKTVVVRFQSVAVREGDALRIDYRRGTEPAPQRGRPIPITMRSSDEESSATWSRFSLEYQRNEQFGEPSSPTHALRARDVGSRHIVEARGTSGDVTVLIPVRRADVAAMTVLTHRAGGEQGFAMITVTPPATSATRATPRDLTFVIDVSGSMQGRKLEQAKAAGEALLATLRPADRFRLIDFSTDVRMFRSAWTNATADNLHAARRYLNDLRAEGSTNISEALRTALDDGARGGTTRGDSRTDGMRNDTARDDDRLPLVVFVTDGEPTVGERDPDAIAALAARFRGEQRVFTVGVGTGVNAALVEQLATQGHGTAHFVRDEESVESAVGLLARRLSTPVLTDVRVSANGVRLTGLLPANRADVFAGQDLVVLARYDGSGDAIVRLEGRSASGPITWSTRAHFVDHDRGNPFVARLWAAQRIGWLAAEKRRNGGTTELDAEIRSLGEHYGIPTEFSSYLVVEPGMKVTNGVVDRRDRSQAFGSAIGAASGASSAPAAPVARRAEVQFEAARSAAKQRDATSLSALDALSDARNERRQVSNRQFTLIGGVWTDARVTPTMRVVAVRPYSALYFDLMRRLPDVQDAFALGDQVIIAGRTMAIALKADGDERMDEQRIAALVRDW